MDVTPHTVETIIPATSPAGGGGRVVATPFQFYFDGNDNLRLRVTSSLAVTVTFAVRFLDDKGVQHLFHATLAAAADRVTASRDLPIGRGFLLNVVAFVSTGAPAPNRVYAQVLIIRGFSGATLIMGALVGAYITATQPAAWPGSVIAPSTDGAGRQGDQTVADPAAGDGWTLAVPTGAIWSLESVAFRVITSADAGARTGYVFAQMAAGARFFVTWPVLLGPSVGANFIFARGVSPDFVAVGDIATAALPYIDRLPAASTIGAPESNNPAGNDTYDIIRVSFREWLEVQ